MACGKGGQLCARQVLHAVGTSAASWPSKTVERFAQQLTASSAGLSWRLDVPYRMGSWLYPSADACVSAFLASFVFIYSPHTFSMRFCSCFRKVWWERVVADGAQLLGNHRSARAVAAFALVGTARWCVVERESMAMVENTSERMRVGGWVGGWICADVEWRVYVDGLYFPFGDVGPHESTRSCTCVLPYHKACLEALSVSGFVYS